MANPARIPFKNDRNTFFIICNYKYKGCYSQPREISFIIDHMKHKLLLLASITAIALSACSLHGKKYEVEKYCAGEIAIEGDSFRILQLTDIHLGDKDDQDLHYKFMNKVIESAEDPDLIVVTGDLFTFASRGTATRFFKFMDSRKKADNKPIPWTVVFGNHDEQVYFDIEWMTSQLEKCKNCYFVDLENDDIQGNCNFYINLTKGGKLFERLIMIDSERYEFSLKHAFGSYDYVKDEQIKWYESVVEQSKKETEDNNVAKSIMFYHIPLPEIDDAFEKGELLDLGDKFGVNKEQLKREKTCPPDFNSGLFAAIKEANSTTDMLFGHDHLNMFVSKYEGVTFAYGVKSTDRVYYAEDMLGGQVATLKTDAQHSVEYKRIFHTYKEVK